MSLFPSPCLLCRKSTFDLVCPECMARVSEKERLEDFALLYTEGARTLFAYGDKELTPLLFAIKNRGDASAGLFLAQLLAARVGEWGIPFSVVTYVPRRTLRVVRDGFDQSRRLCRDLSALCGIPQKTLLRRRGVSRRQHGLDREARAVNVRGKFKAGNAAEETVLLLDDVITTGATVQEAARVLKLAGAKEVWALAPFRGGKV